MSKPKFYVSDMVYGPAKKVDRSKLEQLFQRDHFNEKGCKPCEYRQERPCDVCQDCPNFFGTFKFWGKEKIDGKPYIGVAKGRMDLVEKLFGDLPANHTIDDRIDIPFKTDLKLELDLYDYQKTSVSKMAKFNQGVLQADPRTGKTLMSIALACKKKRRTLIIAHQDDLLRQFYETFTGLNLDGKPSKDFPKATNAEELRIKHGYMPVIVARKPDDFFGKEDVVLTTYQKFITPGGRKLLKKVAKRFGLVIVDEVHRASADCYSQVLSALKPRFMYSLTATPNLKNCIPAYSEVKTPDGDKTMSELKVGDEVYSADSNGLTVTTIVRKTVVEKKPILRIYHESGVFEGTPDHEVWCVNRGCYVQLKDLTLDDELLSW